MAVVYSGSIESCKGMFYCADLDVALEKDGAALGFAYVLCKSLDYRLALKVCSLYFVSIVSRGRVECNCQFKTCVKPLSAK